MVFTIPPRFPFVIGRLPLKNLSAGALAAESLERGVVTDLARDQLAGANYIGIMTDDAPARIQASWHDFQNTGWPGDSFPYASTPRLEGFAAEGVSFMRGGVAARCVPTRHAMAVGRQSHISAAHPHGTGTHNIPQQGGLQEARPFMPGVQASENPWPIVARAARPGIQTYHIGKLHAEETQLNDDGTLSRVDDRQLVDDFGFDEAVLIERGSQLSADEPYRGFVGFEALEMERTGSGTTDVAPGGDPSDWPTSAPAADPNEFMLTFEFNKITAWLDSILSVDETTQFAINWWMNSPHGTLPALEDNIGPGGASLLNTYTFAEQFPWARDAVGRISNSNSPGGAFGPGYDEFGVLGGPGGSTFPGDTGFGAEGCGNTLFRRAAAHQEAIDTIIGLLYDWLATNYPIAFKRTVWSFTCDNGAHDTDITPQVDRRYASAGAEYANVIPPTSDGTIGGDVFYDEARGKNTVFEEGMGVPIIFWGAPLPAAVRGTRSSALTAPEDWYATILDILCGENVWKAELSDEDLAKVDAVSFYRAIVSTSGGLREHSLHQIMLPVLAPEPTVALGQQTDVTLVRRAIKNRAGWKLHRDYDATVDPVVDRWLLFDLKEATFEDDASDLYADAVAGTNAEAALQLIDLRAAYFSTVGNLH